MNLPPKYHQIEKALRICWREIKLAIFGPGEYRRFRKKQTWVPRIEDRRFDLSTDVKDGIIAGLNASGPPTRVQPQRYNHVLQMGEVNNPIPEQRTHMSKMRRLA